jgi:hypothetical protein
MGKENRVSSRRLLREFLVGAEVTRLSLDDVVTQNEPSRVKQSLVKR